MDKNKTLNNYSATHIQVLEGLEAVRKRPGMYIGDTSVKGLHHLIYEVVDNAVDESLAGYCTWIKVIIHEEGITVQDNGRGIPTGLHPTEGCSALEVVMTRLHAGGKFDQKTYKVSGGLHGVGVSCVNALSANLEATVQREGKVFKQTYSKGIPNGPLQEMGTTEETGTKIFFKPDETIFTEKIFQYDIVAKRLRELSFLNPYLKIELVDEREIDLLKQPKTETFYTEEGIVEYVKYLDNGKENILATPIYIESIRDDMTIQIAINYNTGHHEKILSFANNIHTFDGGTHVVGMKRGLTSATKNYGEKSGIFERAKIVPGGDDFREGITIVISVKLADPQFSGQEKGRLTNTNITVKVSAAVNEALTIYLEENPAQAKKIIEKSVLAAQAREAARKARDLVQRKNALFATSLPGTLTDCTSKSPADSEIFLLEGKSAVGTAKGGRNRNTQAILPLRGKIINVEKSTEYKILESEPIRNIITALGVSLQHTEEGRVVNIDKLRYHKIIIMTDADVDGSHIRTLILTLFFRYMPKLIEQGYVYIALPPLYLVKKGKSERYCWTEKEQQEAVLEFGAKGKGEVRVQRYKGLGEMNDDQLWTTTLNPETRVLKQVNVRSIEEANRIFFDLMNNDVKTRRELIEKHAREVDLAAIA